jgi:uncharacterized protein YchJ
MNLKKQAYSAFMMAMIAETMAQDAYATEPPYIMHRNDAPQIHPPKHKGTSIRVDVRTTPKVGVNAPCPCGSGKKNKKCCKMSAMPKQEKDGNR